uniref:Uncharacterized protein n=1 Tax=Knipowitschia caucasica TaxID=637954 RepID=A0AAV2KYE5_KNICA
MEQVGIMSWASALLGYSNPELHVLLSVTALKHRSHSQAHAVQLHRTQSSDICKSVNKSAFRVREERSIGDTTMSYERILSITDLSEVQNPWKGVTMNRCLVLALVVLLVSSGVSELHEAVDYVVEETGIMSFIGSLQDGSILQFSVWDNLKSWWGAEELGTIRRRKKPIGNKAILKPKTKP